MDVWAIAGLVIVIALLWWALQQFSPHLPAIVVTILLVVLVFVSVIALCSVIGIPLPARIDIR